MSRKEILNEFYILRHTTPKKSMIKWPNGAMMNLQIIDKYAITNYQGMADTNHTL